MSKKYGANFPRFNLGRGQPVVFSYTITASLVQSNTTFAVLFILYCSTQWRSWLRHCATSRKIAGSIPDGVTGIFL